MTCIVIYNEPFSPSVLFASASQSECDNPRCSNLLPVFGGYRVFVGNQTKRFCSKKCAEDWFLQKRQEKIAKSHIERMRI